VSVTLTENRILRHRKAESLFIVASQLKRSSQNETRMDSAMVGCSKNGLTDGK